MLINITNPIFETVVLTCLLLFFIIISLKKKDNIGLFPISVTNELKGVAILSVIFMHIGYFLMRDTRFLFPLSVFGGVGVDIFLFISGYGLAISSAKKDLNPWQFYLRRLSKIVVPVWLTLAILVLADKFFLNISYGWIVILQNFLGFFPVADIYKNINSPLWFITLILFFYLIFPLLFSKKRPIFSAIMIFLAGFVAVNLTLPVGAGVLGLYKMHIAAFPLGVAFFGVLGGSRIVSLIPLKILQVLSSLATPFKSIFHKMKVNKMAVSVLESIKKSQISYHAGFMFILAVIAIYTGINSGVGRGVLIEEAISIITALTLVILFLVKKSEFGFLAFLGQYSFEIYLIHWPLMYRYDVVYKLLPAWLATLVYIVILIALAYVMKLVCDSTNKLVSSKLKRKSV